MSRRKTHSEFIEQFNKLNTSKFINVLGIYIDSKTRIKCYCTKHNVEWDIMPFKLLAGQGCIKCHSENVGLSHRLSQEEYISRVKRMNPHLELLEPFKTTNSSIRVKCTIDGYEWDAFADTLLCKHGVCPCCNNRVVVKGVNDITTTHPHIAEWILNKEDSIRYHSGSNAAVNFLCPDCGYVFNRQIPSICRSGIKCPRCGDGLSFPEKFMLNFLTYLNEDFSYDTSFDWSNNRRYDFYIARINTIIECHGIQHYEDRHTRNRPFKEEHENDILKERLAIQNGIDNYIVIDSRISSVKFILNNIMQSDLSILFDLSNIDWSVIAYKSSKSFVRETCILANKGLSKKEIAKIIGVSNVTIYKYLKLGAEMKINVL